jgi:mono/diheme cytochrome c family protein
MRSDWNTLLRLSIWIFLSCGSVFSAQAPVSYGRQIAPLFALYCAGCHGLSNPSSGLRVTQFAALRAGGDMGDDVVPGRPEASTLMHLIEGKRGPRQRMPQDSAPLTAAQIALIRRWISEGAKNDRAESPCFEMRITSVTLSSSAPLEVSARLAAPAFLTLALLPNLYQEEASVNAPKERANIAAPGEWIRWRLVREQAWPFSATVTLRIQYSIGSLDGTVLTAGEQSSRKLVRMSCPPP